jgi:hypothetical protein
VHTDDGLASPGPVIANPHPYDFGAKRFLPDIDRVVKPDVMLVMHDAEYCALVARTLPAHVRRCALITYSPLEGDIAHPEVLWPLCEADAVVLYSRRDAMNVRAALGQAEPQANQELRGPRVTWIPHGVDRTTFRPISQP